MIEIIIFFYIMGFLLFAFFMWEQKIPDKFIWGGFSIFVNIMGYYISYLDTDATYSAYFSLVLLIMSLIMMIYYMWSSFSHEVDEFNESDNDENSGYIE